MNIQQLVRDLNIEERLRALLYYENAIKHSLEWGMNYILFSPSKRIRPLLLLETNRLFGDIDDDAYTLAACVELIHTYSLVHDDLPCMDDDRLRRGQPTLHTIINDAYAVLTGDALLTRGFGILSAYSKNDKIPQILRLVYEKSGEMGMIKGQRLDLMGEGFSLDIESINEINYFKTCNMIQLSMMLGAINAGYSGDLKIIEELGSIIGHIFQIQDDILDITGNTLEIGKETGSDQKKKKSSMPLVMGLQKAEDYLKNLGDAAILMIKSIPNGEKFFIQLIEYLVNRTR